MHPSKHLFGFFKDYKNTYKYLIVPNQLFLIRSPDDFNAIQIVQVSVDTQPIPKVLWRSDAGMHKRHRFANIYTSGSQRGHYRPSVGDKGFPRCGELVLGGTGGVR